jgi:hypothetical protein
MGFFGLQFNTATTYPIKVLSTCMLIPYEARSCLWKFMTGNARLFQNV